MTITKLGHCCLVIEENGVRIMTDPGAYSTRQHEEKNIDYIFITHEHQDHFHLESLKRVLVNNPRARIVTNRGVGSFLEAEHIPCTLLEQGNRNSFGGVEVEGHGDTHATIYEDFGMVQNTGYFFANRFFYPGDAFFHLGRPIEILALPVAGPWMRIGEAIDYAKLLKPKIAFPVHDGMLRINTPTRVVPERFLTRAGISFVDIGEGTPHIFS